MICYVHTTCITICWLKKPVNLYIYIYEINSIFLEIKKQSTAHTKYYKMSQLNTYDRIHHFSFQCGGITL